MTKRMLIDATHAEETRVVVLDGTRLEDFDVETSTKKQLKGNIYLAKVVRVEPSLQAAFVEYGGNRHGFLAFGEIHPDYYQIPVADRQRLLAMQAEEARQEEEEEDRAAAAGTEAPTGQDRADDAEGVASPPAEATSADLVQDDSAVFAAGEAAAPPDETDEAQASEAAQPLAMDVETLRGPPDVAAGETATPTPEDGPVVSESDDPVPGQGPEPSQPKGSPISSEGVEPLDPAAAEEHHAEPAADLPPPETVGGDSDLVDEARGRRPAPRFLRNYRIQEVIRRRQILLVQVVKEERGTKGAALTTYLSLAGRYCVLMPNSPRGGGISRKITSAADRRRLKEITSEMDLPPGMGLIVRTAGANRPKPEIKRDCEYLMRLWDDIREHTLKSVAPALIYEEASLIKRAIRDVYSRDVDEIVVDGEDGWKAARDFMRMLMPTHAKKVQLWRDGGMPLFARNQVEAQLDGMMMPTVQLRSGGYLVINQTEALVAIDVNSGRSTRERNVEETALRTNLEASDEVARQLRLRDLAGLIVIDYIDMESRKHNAMVEKRLKDALKNDRARIQVGHISHFGLLEMSRQRLRPSLAETSFVMCVHCGGTGHVRSIESAALHVLRHIEEEGAKRRAAEVLVHVAGTVAMYILNHKRDLLHGIEQRYGMQVTFQADSTLVAPQIRIERVRAQVVGEAPLITAEAAPVLPRAPESDGTEEEEISEGGDLEEVEESRDVASVPASGTEGESGEEQRRRRRRRRRRGGRRDEVSDAVPGLASAPAEAAQPLALTAAEQSVPADDDATGANEPAGAEAGEDEAGRGRRRGRRGGRRRRRVGEEDVSPVAELDAEQPELPGAPYKGPTPANPFGSHAYDIFDVIEQAEQIRPETPLALKPTANGEFPAESAITASAAPEPEPPVAPEVAPEPPPIPSPPELARGMDVIDAAEPADTVRFEPGEPPPEPEAAYAEPPPEPPPAAAEHPSLEHAEPEAAEPVAPEPAVRPILVGAGDAPLVEKKRGWWRR